ncbi:sensor histidine kinase NtrY-like [Marinimicrococcus flavescens]|uniref:histidine kinase n=1 Tax=Marinimicrococcus flavescens TaxID=3031815 RepID=A0AAP4D5Z1_9PROT|nr:PAS domain-containing sensor histidine kinase [Marinimicrococcus flavescens]
MLSSVNSALPGLKAAVRRFDVERRLALLLTVCAVILSIATYGIITWAPPWASVQVVLILLNLDLVLLLALGVVVTRRIVRLMLERRQGSAGSRLHSRLVALFSVVAVTPAILVAIFSVLFLSSGLEAWFSERVRTALDNSLAVAEAYLVEHKEVIRADALAMAADLNREGPALLENANYLRQFVVAQAALRALTEAIVFDGTGRVLAHSGLGFSLEVGQIPKDALDRAYVGEVVTLTSESDDRVRALLRLESFGEIYLFVGRFIEPRVLTFMERTQQVVSEYRRLESERSGIQITSSLIFIVVALLLLFASVWVGLNFADQLAMPISRLIRAAEQVRGGDLMARVPETGGEDEITTLSRAFNRMTSQLDSQRRELVAANSQLDQRRRFTEAVLAGVTAGVLSLDGQRRVLLHNRAAVELLLHGEGAVEGQAVTGILPEIAPLFERLESRPGEAVEEQLEVRRDGLQRTLLVRLAAQAEGDAIAGYVVTFDDISDLLSAQRQAAWAEVARRIAHEIKNPLTPIRLSAERLNRRFRAQIAEEDQDGFARSVDTIVRQVDAIGRLVTEFSAFARMPAAVLKSEPMTEMIRHAVLLQQTAWPSVSFTIEIPERDPLRLEADAEKVGQVLTNLLQNAANAIAEHPAGGAEGQMAAGQVMVRGRREGEAVIVEVEDSGPGFPAGDRARLLEPYATTRAKGTGLGLAIVRKIMEEHSGKVDLLDGRGGGALVRLTFPARGAA